MVVALILVPIVTIMNSNGLGPAFDTIRSVDPTRLDIFKGASTLGMISIRMGPWLCRTTSYYRTLYGNFFCKRT